MKVLQRTHGIGVRPRAYSPTKSSTTSRPNALQVQHVVRNAELLADAARVVDRVERAAGPVRKVVAVAEELHRRADDVVALLDEQRGGDGRIDAARHRDEDRAADVSARDPVSTGAPCSTRAGKTSATRSTCSSVVSAPRLMRTAAFARSAGDADRRQHVRRR